MEGFRVAFRGPTASDPIMTQSARTDFPRELERQIVDGGVREGRPEARDSNGLLWLLALVLGFMVIVGVVLNWRLLFP